MTEQERTAYHEAGHSRIAYSITPASVDLVRIFQVEGTWNGESNIDLAGMNDIQRAAIAIGGLLSEARAAAIGEEGDHTRQILLGAQLNQELGRVIGIAVENRLAAVDANIPCTTPPAGSAPVLARLTLEDIVFIPDEIAGNDAQIGAAAALACAIINHHIEWGSIIAIAQALIENAPNPLPNFFDVIAPH